MYQREQTLLWKGNATTEPKARSGHHSRETQMTDTNEAIAPNKDVQNYIFSK